MKLEANNTTCVELYAIMYSFRPKLAQRHEDQFFGDLTKVKLQRLSPVDANRAMGEFILFIETAISLRNGLLFQIATGFSTSSPSPSRIASLSRDVEKVNENLSFTTRVDMDKLYDESVTGNCILEQLLKDAQ
ncbi:Hypothetical predicted protein [Podarcis lilfordi]|uniref:Uncharacterized protein n=1 Tax=Podarcis lilfordi TaxID=74358 RepID=A0AA35P2Q1_9SAUR|nr:Hypothetical predicted protein [Podarcis lilfordi]